jgi:hypothetical protein
MGRACDVTTGCRLSASCIHGDSKLVFKKALNCDGFQNHSKYDRHGTMVLPWANMQPSFLSKWDEPSMLRALLAKHPLVSRSPAPWTERNCVCV